MVPLPALCGVVLGVVVATVVAVCAAAVVELLTAIVVEELATVDVELRTPIVWLTANRLESEQQDRGEM